MQLSASLVLLSMAATGIFHVMTISATPHGSTKPHLPASFASSPYHLGIQARAIIGDIQPDQPADINSLLQDLNKKKVRMADANFYPITNYLIKVKNQNAVDYAIMVSEVYGEKDNFGKILLGDAVPLHKQCAAWYMRRFGIGATYRVGDELP
ncbi:hypothetical protein BC835DRAFT_1398648 [Cytidiella melzeri]|nr:hypothetical protein BC835DRAFT_1398648 [Cytidiella melzeri]